MLLAHAHLTIQDAHVVTAALDQFWSRPTPGFTDCLVIEIAGNAGHVPLGTFDRRLGRLAGTQRLA